jgi:DnaJ like chaperone protein
LKNTAVSIRGKLIGAILGLIVCDLIGLPLGELVGLVLGAVLGHYFIDVPLGALDGSGPNDVSNEQRKQGAFIYHVFRLCAKVAKADGKVSHAEVAFMERLMQTQFRLSDQRRRQAISIWNEAKNSRDSFDVFAHAFYREFAKDRHLIMNMMDLLFAVAACEGSIHPRQEQMLMRAAGLFHVSRMQYDRIRIRYAGSGSNRASTPPRTEHSLAIYYAELGASPGDSLDAVKKKFRALALQWHPDKVASKGATPAMLEQAKERFQKINTAYEKIVAAHKG